LKRSYLVSHITNKDLRKEVQRVRNIGEEEYGSTKMGYDLKRLLMKKIIKKVEGTHKYIFTKTGYKNLFDVITNKGQGCRTYHVWYKNRS